MDELHVLLQQENNDLADCLAENEFLLKVAYLCDIFPKLNIFVQGQDKNIPDVSGEIAAFIKKLPLWKEGIESLFGSSQYSVFFLKEK